MRLSAILVEYKTPDVLELALASLRRFAPEVEAVVVPGQEGAAAHAEGIAEARRRRLVGDADGVILLDTDVCITSPRWVERLQATVSAGGIWGGLKHKGDVSQVIHEGQLIIHANCLAMPRDLFEAVPSFAAVIQDGAEFVEVDTAAGVSLFAAAKGRPVVPLPCFRVGHGPLFPGLNCAEYFDPLSGRETLWSHLGRGTSARPRHPRLQALKAALGFRAARKIWGWQQTRQAWIARGRDLLKTA